MAIQRQEQQESSAQVSSLTCPLPRPAEMKKGCVDAAIDGVKCKVLVDTGAELSLINLSTVLALNGKVTSTRMSCHSASLHSMPIVGETVLTVQIGSRSTQHLFYVTKYVGSTQFSAICGWELLDGKWSIAEELAVFFGFDIVAMRERGRTRKLNATVVNSLHIDNSLVRSSETVAIPPKTEKVIRAKAQYPRAFDPTVHTNILFLSPGKQCSKTSA